MPVPWDCVLYVFLLVIVNAHLIIGEFVLDSVNLQKGKKNSFEALDFGKNAEFFAKYPEKLSATIKSAEYFVSFIASALVVRTALSYAKSELYESVYSNPLLLMLFVLASLLVLAIVMLTFGVYMPRRIAILKEDKLKKPLSGFIRVLYYLFFPVICVVNFFGWAILRIFGIDTNKIEEEVTEDEIRLLIDAGNESGNIEESEKDMLHNIFEFDDRVCVEIMTHRTEVCAVEKSTPIEEVVDIALEEGYSRIPVYEETLDNIVGLLYVKDLITLLKSSSSKDFSVEKYMRPTIYVPETAKVKELFGEFKKTHIQMAIVIDEYGGTSGIVTMEDLIESIVGSINDEYDDEKDEEKIETISDGEYCIEGVYPIREVEEFLGFEITDEQDDCDTLSGYIIGKLGRIPEEGEHPEVAVKNVVFTVESVKEHRIDKVVLQVLPEEEEKENEE